MYSKICRWFSKKLIANKYMDSEKQEIFEFGLENILSKIFSWALLLIVGLTFHGFFESIIFYFVFAYSRKHAGGYHANTYTKCNTLYILTFLGCLLLSRYGISVIGQDWFLITVSVFLILTVLVFAPINNPNNPILPGKENRFFILAMVINILIILAVFVMRLMMIDLWIFITLTMLSSALYMHIEILKRREWDLKTIKDAFSKKLVNLAMKNAKGTTREVSMHGIFQPKRPAVLDKQENK